MKKNWSLPIILILAVFFSSCKKEKSNIVSAKDNAIVEIAVGDVFKVADNTFKQEKLTGKMQSSACATVTITPMDTTTYPKTIVVDFGPVNCLGDDGRIRRGKILINLSNKYKTAGSVATITTDGYYVNDYAVTGTHTITNNGLDSDGHINFILNASGCTITTPSGGSLTWESTRNYKWLEGDATLTVYDDVYTITGAGNGINSEGDAYTVTITTQLLRDMSCKWFKSGAIEVSNAGGGEMLLDFGGGTCDNAASVTINGETYNINLN